MNNRQQAIAADIENALREWETRRRTAATIGTRHLDLYEALSNVAWRYAVESTEW